MEDHSYQRVNDAKVVLDQCYRYLISELGDLCYVLRPEEGVLTVLPVAGHDHVRCVIGVNQASSGQGAHYEVRIVSYNMQTIHTVIIPGDNIGQLRHIVHDMVRGRYKHCHGLTLPHHLMNTCLSSMEDSDLSQILIDKFAERLSYRSRHCSNVMDTGQEDDKVTRDNCPHCRILSSLLLDKYSCLSDKTEETPRRRGRPRGSKNKVKEVQFLDDDEDFDADLVIDSRQSQSSVKDESQELKCEQSGSLLRIDEDRNLDLEEQPESPMQAEEDNVSDVPSSQTCTQCDKEFSSNYEYKIHLQNHAGPGAIICNSPDCNQIFHNQQDLRKHLKVHSVRPEKLKPPGEKQYQCQYCEKDFLRKGALKVHIASIHSELKKYLCADCGSAFKSNSALIDHKKRVHLQCKKHKCDFCGKEFFSKKDFAEHTRTHTGEKPYQCGYCGKAFARQYHLKRHNDNVHRFMTAPPPDRSLSPDDPGVLTVVTGRDHEQDQDDGHHAGEDGGQLVSDTTGTTTSSYWVPLDLASSRQHSSQLYTSQQ